MTLGSGQILNNRYLIEGLLGEGGFGSVYRARDNVLARQCAVKENLESSERAHRQFEREARILANLSHPNLPRVTDHFVIQGQGQYLVMDLVLGSDLEQIVLAQQKPLPEAQAVGWILEAAEALDYLHSQHPPIIHRDVKPANIIISGGGRAFLVDFGLAKIYDPQVKTTLGAFGVSPGYSPQEQYSRGKTDIRSDIYSLGATLYFILTGEEPPESIQRNLGTVLTPPRALNAGISPQVERAILKAMEMQPNLRYRSVSEFKDALRGNFPQALNNKPATSAGKSTARAGVNPKLYGAGGTLIGLTWPAILLFAIIVSVVFILTVFRFRISNTSLPANPSAFLVPQSSLTITETPVNSVRTPVPTTSMDLLRLPEVYIIKPGDTCSEIAFRLGIEMEAIWQLNNFPGECEHLLADQRILIPAPSQNVRENTPPVTVEALKPTEIKIATKDGMEQIFVPGGVFWRGSNEDDPDAKADEKPQQAIYLDSFWIDKTEVTNAMYQGCVLAGFCSPPSKNSSRRNFTYFDNEVFRDYPVIYVSWTDADNYCQWAGRRLPTEAEWEKAARGIDGRVYPWGDNPPTGKLANYNNQVGDTTPVGSYPEGVSPYGVMDLAGNVAEWVADWYDPNYYSISPVFNPIGPTTGEFRILRGGSWLNLSYAIRTGQRLWNFPGSSFEGGGFRCATSGMEN